MGLQDIEDFGFGEVEAEGFEGDFELVVVDVGVFVEVEEGKLQKHVVIVSMYSRGRMLLCAGMVLGTYSFIDLLPLLLTQRFQRPSLLRFPAFSLCPLSPLAL